MQHRFNNVMLIDDSDLDNFIHKEIIEHSQIAKNVLVHASASSALNFFAKLMTLGDGYQAMYPEIIFVDINMPVMDGFQCVEELMKISEKLLVRPKLFILTSSQFPGDLQRAQALSPGIGFLSKPLSPAKLELI